MKRIRFSLRTLLFTIAALCLVLGGGRQWYVHAAKMNRFASEFDQLAQRRADTAWGLQRLPVPEPGSEQDKMAQRYWGIYHEYKKIADLYRRAAWWPLSPEPKFKLPEDDMRPRLDFFSHSDLLKS